MLVACVVVPASAFGQDHGSGSTAPNPHPIAFGFFDGDSAASDTAVYDVRIPIGYPLFTAAERSWGLRLRLILYAGVYDFTVDEAIDLDLRFQSLAATPGVEFILPVGDAWTLKPFAEIGYGQDFDNALGFGVWSMGMRTLATWPVGNFHFSLGTKFQYVSTFTSDIGLTDDFGEVLLGFDARRSLPFTIGASQGDLSLYFIRRQYIDAFIAREDLEPLEIHYTNEVGVTFGATPNYRLWFIDLPRIGFGYRWGPNVSGVRLNFGFPF